MRHRSTIYSGAFAGVAVALVGIIARLLTRNLAMLDGTAYLLVQTLVTLPSNPTPPTFAAAAFFVEAVVFAIAGGLSGHLLGGESAGRAAIAGSLAALALQTLFFLQGVTT